MRRCLTRQPQWRQLSVDRARRNNCVSKEPRPAELHTTVKDSALLATMAATLEGLRIAMCVFDGEDRTLLWNRTFLEFFPEHDGQVFVGEPYRENLRRYYRARLGAQELPKLEGYVEEAVARHRAQSRPFAFAHRGRYLRVSSLSIAGGGRVRIWVDESRCTRRSKTRCARCRDRRSRSSATPMRSTTCPTASRWPHPTARWPG
jgi:PAS domain-containing protein